jgi:hypothetical protein
MRLGPGASHEEKRAGAVTGPTHHVMSRFASRAADKLDGRQPSAVVPCQERPADCSCRAVTTWAEVSGSGMATGRLPVANVYLLRATSSALMRTSCCRVVSSYQRRAGISVPVLGGCWWR